MKNACLSEGDFGAIRRPHIWFHASVHLPWYIALASCCSLSAVKDGLSHSAIIKLFRQLIMFVLNFWRLKWLKIDRLLDLHILKEQVGETTTISVVLLQVSLISSLTQKSNFLLMGFEHDIICKEYVMSGYLVFEKWIRWAAHPYLSDLCEETECSFNINPQVVKWSHCVSSSFYFST